MRSAQRRSMGWHLPAGSGRPEGPHLLAENLGVKERLRFESHLFNRLFDTEEKDKSQVKIAVVLRICSGSLRVA